MSTMYIIRGLPGSGKTTLGKTLCGDRSFAADDYFEFRAEIEGKTYSDVFNPEELAKAHELCQERVVNSMNSGEDVAVCNTFSQEWEAEPYFEMARDMGYKVTVIECQNRFENTHNVPDATIHAMAQRWERIS